MRIIEQFVDKNSIFLCPKEFVKLCSEYDLLSLKLEHKLKEMHNFIESHSKQFSRIINIGDKNAKREETSDGKGN